MKILHGRNGREYNLPELPRFSEDVYLHETNTIYESFGTFSGTRANRSVTSSP